MSSVLCAGVQSAGEPGVVAVGSITQGVAEGGLPCERTGNCAAATAAGLSDVWSAIRLLITRGCESNTKPFFCAYEEEGIAGLPGPKKPAGAPSACRKTGEPARRGNGTSAAANFSRPGRRLLHDPSTVRRPYEVSASGIWSGPGPTSVPHGFAGVAVAAWCSAILICLRMNDRSPGVTVNPFPTTLLTPAFAVVRAIPSPAAAASTTTEASARPILALVRRGVSVETLSVPTVRRRMFGTPSIGGACRYGRRWHG